MGLTHSPDPPYLLAGAGTAADQTARGRSYASGSGVGYAPSAPAAYPTGAIAGSPGAWVPGNSYPPLSVADAIAHAPAPGIATAWTTGQFNWTRDLGMVHWTGTAWAGGKAP